MSAGLADKYDFLEPAVLQSKVITEINKPKKLSQLVTINEVSRDTEAFRFVKEDTLVLPQKRIEGVAPVPASIGESSYIVELQEWTLPIQITDQAVRRTGEAGVARKLSKVAESFTTHMDNMILDAALATVEVEWDVREAGDKGRKKVKKTSTPVTVELGNAALDYKKFVEVLATKLQKYDRDQITCILSDEAYAELQVDDKAFQAIHSYANGEQGKYLTKLAGVTIVTDSRLGERGVKALFVVNGSIMVTRALGLELETTRDGSAKVANYIYDSASTANRLDDNASVVLK